MAEDEKPPPKIARRARVTLKLDAHPLLLPGERDRRTPAPITRDLELPSAYEPGPPSDAPKFPEGEDAWARQRATPPRSAPPPAPVPEPEEGGVLDLVDRRSRPSTPTVDLSEEMHDRYALGDYTAALLIAELILGRVPDHDGAARIATSCRERLGQLYLSRLGSLHRVPRVAIDASEVRWLGLHHRAAFLLSRIDGLQTITDILDVGGMPRVEALKTLVELLDMGAIGFDD